MDRLGKAAWAWDLVRVSGAGGPVSVSVAVLSTRLSLFVGDTR